MSILALDLSTKSTGWAVYDKKQQLERYGCITATDKDPIVRIIKIVKELYSIMKEENDLEVCVMEEVKPAEEDDRNFHTYKILMYLQSIVVLLLHEQFPHTKIDFLYPNEWRKNCGIKTGKGLKRKELKEKDIAFVKKYFNIDNINDDIADAISLGYGYIQKTSVINWV